MLRPTLWLASLVSLAAAPLAQLESDGQPASIVHQLDPEVPLVVLPRPDVERYLAEDAGDRRIVRPFRYGAVVEASIDLDLHGLWAQVDATGDLVWRVEISSPGAYSLGILFAEYDLPPGGELYVYAPDRKDVMGAFTEETEQPNGMLQIRPLRGDRLVLEYVHPADVSGTPRLRVESVVHDYRDVFRHLGGSGVDAACLIDVNCPQGAPYQDIKRSIVALFAGGFTCTGSILNNTAYDGTPYMLTAEHCGVFTNGTFVFNYERTGCGSGGSNLDDSLSGAKRLAKDAYVDSQIYLLNQTPPESYTPFYAGWTRGTSPPGPGVGISHPSGLPMKIHIDDQDPEDLFLNWGTGWEQGEIKWGSSGSPLFAGNKRVIGALSTAGGSCAGQTCGYGQFKRFYFRRSLGQWLDPLGGGAVFVDGYDPFAATSIPYNGSGSNPNVYTSVTPPAIGTTWVAEIDLTGHPGATGTLIEGRAAASSGAFFSWGEALIDFGSPLRFRSVAGVTGSLSTHSKAIPNDPGIAGAIAFSQGLILGSTIEGTNGVELRVF